MLIGAGGAGCAGGAAAGCGTSGAQWRSASTDKINLDASIQLFYAPINCMDGECFTAVLALSEAI